LRLLSLSVGGERPLAEVVRREAPALTEELPRLAAILDDYARRKLQMGALDFDDLLLLLRLLLHDHPPVAAAVSEQFQHVLVDEYQDTSPLEAALVDQLARPTRASSWSVTTRRRSTASAAATCARSSTSPRAGPAPGCCC